MIMDIRSAGFALAKDLDGERNPELDRQSGQ